VTTTITVCDLWDIELPEQGATQWFLDWYLRSPGEVHKHLWAGWAAYQSIADLEIASATEYFGGIGAQSRMIQQLWAPERHYVFDYSKEAAEHLRASLPPPIAAWQADSYDPWSFRRAGLVGLDFGDLTVWRTREGEKHRALLDRVFASEPKAVVFTDIAGPRLHLQRARYETLLGAGSCESYETYLSALLDRLEALYGYVCAGGAWHRWSAVMALTTAGERRNPEPLAHHPNMR
jgi:hypothetical protein